MYLGIKQYLYRYGFGIYDLKVDCMKRIGRFVKIKFKMS